MQASSSSPAAVVHDDHRGWRLQARCFHAFANGAAGWICLVSSPSSVHELNIGRWDSSDEALANGRGFVDRRLAAAIRTSTTRPAPSGRCVPLAA